MKRVLLGMSFLGAAALAHAETQVFFTDFDTTIPAEISAGTATLTGVQSYAGLGPAGNQFGGTFLRSATGNTVTLLLTGLPQHSAINLEFLFAAIDSLDGTGTFPSGDFFNVTLDGVSVFRESFANALPSQIQSYVPPPGVELARHADASAYSSVAVEQHSPGKQRWNALAYSRSAVQDMRRGFGRGGTARNAATRRRAMLHQTRRRPAPQAPAG